MTVLIEPGGCILLVVTFGFIPLVGEDDRVLGAIKLYEPKTKLFSTINRTRPSPRKKGAANIRRRALNLARQGQASRVYFGLGPLPSR